MFQKIPQPKLLRVPHAAFSATVTNSYQDYLIHHRNSVASYKSDCVTRFIVIRKVEFKKLFYFYFDSFHQFQVEAHHHQTGKNIKNGEKDYPFL